MTLRYVVSGQLFPGHAGGNKAVCLLLIQWGSVNVWLSTAHTGVCRMVEGVPNTPAVVNHSCMYNSIIECPALAII